MSVFDHPAHERQCLVLLGMHRSGTSALTRVLNLLGAELGHNLMAPKADNKKGFWEHLEVVRIHDELLHALGRSWDDERPLPVDWAKSEPAEHCKSSLRQVVESDFAESSLWSVKDPRLCRFIPLWTDLLKELRITPKFLITLRHPDEVALSLAKRNGLPMEESYLLWLAYMLRAEKDTREFPRTFVTFDDLLADWKKSISDIEVELSVNLSVSSESIARQIDEFLESGMKTKFRVDGEVLHRSLAVELYDQLATAAQGTDPNEENIELIARQAGNATQNVAPWVGRIRELEFEISDARKNFETKERAMHEYVQSIRSSVSWKLAKPFRLMEKFLRGS